MMKTSFFEMEMIFCVPETGFFAADKVARLTPTEGWLRRASEGADGVVGSATTFPRTEHN